MHNWKRLSLAVVVVGLASFVTIQEKRQPGVPLPASLIKASHRKIYPFSVIPGGAMSVGELRNALFADKVAARHYADFRLDRTRVESVREPLKVFVSYRIQNRIYWTQKRLVLPKGETILTDGVASARTRCGNRISEVPQFPVDAANEPTPEVLNSESAETVKAALNPLPEATDSGTAWTAKLMSTAPPSGDLLARFGPELNGSSLSGPAYQSGGSSGGGGSAGSGGTNGGSGTNGGGQVNNRGGAMTTGGSGSFGGQTSGQVVSSNGSTLTANNSIPTGSTRLTSTIALPNATLISLPIVFTPTASFAGGFFIPPIPIADQAHDQISLSPSTHIPSYPGVAFTPAPTFTIGMTNPETSSPATLLSKGTNHDAETPEPHTFAMAACGIALVCLGFLKHTPKKRRALR